MKEKKLTPGQNLRYTGKGFSGYIKTLPYMSFISYQGPYRLLVKYNEKQIVVNETNIEVL